MQKISARTVARAVRIHDNPEDLLREQHDGKLPHGTTRAMRRLDNKYFAVKDGVAAQVTCRKQGYVDYPGCTVVYAGCAQEALRKAVH